MNADPLEEAARPSAPERAPGTEPAALEEALRRLARDALLRELRGGATLEALAHQFGTTAPALQLLAARILSPEAYEAFVARTARPRRAARRGEI